MLYTMGCMKNKILSRSPLNKKSLFAVGITTCYGKGQIVRTIKSIRKSQNVGEFPIYVVSDRIPIGKITKQKFQKLGVTLIENKTPSSVFAKQRQILNISQSDIVIFTQDDVLFASDTIKKVLDAFSNDPKVTFVGVKNTPLPSPTLFGSAINVGTFLNNDIARFWNSGDNYLAVLGRLMAFRTSWIKNKMQVHDNAVSLDAYLYFENKRAGGKYKCIWDIGFYFKNPENMDEQLKKSSRFQNSKTEMLSYKKFKDLQKEYKIPKNVILFASKRQFFYQPINFLLYIFIYIYTRLRKTEAKKCLTPIWDVDISTKNLR